MMAALYLPDELIHEIEEIAQGRDESVESIVKAMLEAFKDKDIEDRPLLAIALAAERAGLRSGFTDTACRSREILDNEFADYITRNWKSDGSTDNSGQ
jgi:hypothetical protein